MLDIKKTCVLYMNASFLQQTRVALATQSKYDKSVRERGREMSFYVIEDISVFNADISDTMAWLISLTSLV